MQMESKKKERSLSELLHDEEYWAAIRGADKSHITSSGESICGLVFPQNNPKRSKQEGACRRRDPQTRKPWKRWFGIEEIPREYGLCGMCLNVRLGKQPTEETYADIAADVREMAGMGGSGPTFRKKELRQLRTYLEVGD